ncbi:hypothetical protein LNQ52_16655 [Klebsiella pneumoniae subsp. pneumoniae]|nr:hypothetical protein [Klebsiella pneumoniae subsp. pneumoniae]
MEQDHIPQQARIATGDDIRNGLTGVRDLRFLLDAQREFRLPVAPGSLIHVRRCNMYVVQRVFFA